MSIRKLSPMQIMHGIITIVHIPLILLIYMMQPFIKIRFGYFSTGRIGHFASDLGYAIAMNKNQHKNEVNFYYLQDDISNTQLEIIAKRELNVSQYYKYFVYAYTALGLKSKVVIPYRHKCGSRDTTGITYNSTYDIILLNRENLISESYMKKYGWTQGEKFVCLNVRDKAFFSESESSRHAYRNSNIDDYETAANYLLDLGYWVVRMGKNVERPFNINHSKLIDYGADKNGSALLDIWFCKNCEFFISTGTGIDSVALMFKKQTLIVNLLPIIDIISWVNGITLPKRLFWNSGKELSLIEHLNNSYGNTHQYIEKGIKVVDLSPGEIRFAVKEMVDRLNNVPLTSRQIKMQKEFWIILEGHELYNKFHGFRDPEASFGISFLKNSPNFLQ